MGDHHRIMGWDIGGAHVKAALLEVRLDGAGNPMPDWRLCAATQIACPLWQGLERLDQALLAARSHCGPARCHSLTMTGELVDIFPDRCQGVRQILDRVAAILRPGDLSCVVIYAGGRDFLNPEAARRQADCVASANWQALGALIGDHLPSACNGWGLMLDIGSTTTDILVLRDHRPRPQAFDDHRRLQAGELVYSGVGRTPLMALTPGVPFEGVDTPMMAETFATTGDIYRLLGWLQPHSDLSAPADGGGKTATDSARRLARMVGLDAARRSEGVWVDLARHLAEVQINALSAACRDSCRRAGLPAAAPVIGSGCGSFLAEKIAQDLQRPYRGIADLLGVDDQTLGLQAAIAAPAVAVAWLAALSRAL